MLKHAANLSDANEYFIAWLGETNARPWGTKAEGFSLFPDLELAPDGFDFTATLSAAGGTQEIAITSGASVAIAENEFVGSRVRVGTTIAPLIGYGTIDFHDAIAAGGSGNLTLTWTVDDASAGSVDLYVVREDRKWGSYPSVRVLTPYQPVDGADSLTDAVVPYPSSTENSGRSTTLPAPYSGALTSTTFDEIGVLLPFSFHEGINGFGISDVSDSTADPRVHAITVVSGTLTKTWTFGGTNTLSANDLLNGGYVIVDWIHATLGPKRSWAPIVDSTTTTFDVVTADWLGDGDPDQKGIGARYTAWIPHYEDSPFAYLPGEGYSYPNHDMMPCAATAIGANVRNRPRGVTGSAYGDTFGALLVAASKISAATGKRVNVVNLAVTDATLAPSNTLNPYGFNGTLGWWNQNNHATWDPSDSTSVYARLDKLLRTALPNAITAEGSTKPLKCLGIVWNHGETDALGSNARQSYGRAQRLFIDALRRLIVDLEYSPYENGAVIPYVQPRIAVLPYGIDGSYTRDSGRGGGTETYDADATGMINTAIQESVATDEFASTVWVDDLPRDSDDPGIYSGAGEASLGSRIGNALSILVDHGLGYGSASLNDADTRLLDICNIALSHVGDAGQITALSENSTEASLCRKFLPEARDELLQSAQWGFALRRRQLVAIQQPESRIYEDRAYCYVVPAEAVFSFKVLGPTDELSTLDFDYSEVTQSGYEATFIANGGSSMTPPDVTLGPVGSNPRSPTGGGGVVVGPSASLPLICDHQLQPQRYSIEQSPYGDRYIFTDQEQATVQYVARVVDADLYSPLFATALGFNLASKVASTMIKGKEGEAVSMRLMQKAGAYLRSAASSDANQQNPFEGDGPFEFEPDHMAYRDGFDRRFHGRGDNLNHYPTGSPIR